MCFLLFVFLNRKKSISREKDNETSSSDLGNTGTHSRINPLSMCIVCTNRSETIVKEMKELLVFYFILFSFFLFFFSFTNNNNKKY